MLAYSQMATAQSWQIMPSLPDIQAAMKEIGDTKKVILCIYFGSHTSSTTPAI